MRPAACLNGFECAVKLNTKDPAVNLAQSNVKGMKEMLYPASFWSFLCIFISIVHCAQQAASCITLNNRLSLYANATFVARSNIFE